MNKLVKKPSLSSFSSNELLSIESKIAQPKNIFLSKTFWGIIFTTVASIAPIIGNSIDRRELTGNTVANIVVILCGTGATLVGRIDAGNVYTPKSMPGPNKVDKS